MIVDHGHRSPQPTGYERRLIKVPDGVDVVEYPVPTYDELITLGCPLCIEEGAKLEREHLLGLLSLSDEDPDHAPLPGFLSDRRALFLSGWHERAQAFRDAVALADRAKEDEE